MNFNAVNVVMFATGAILVYCAIKDKTPKEVMSDAFNSGSSSAGSKPPTPPKSSTAADPVRPGSSAPSRHAPVTSN